MVPYLRMPPTSLRKYILAISVILAYCIAELLAMLTWLIFGSAVIGNRPMNIYKRHRFLPEITR